MANVKITELTAETNPASTDVLPIVDVSADLTKKVSIADLLENAGTGSAAAPSFSFDGRNDTGIYSPSEGQVAISTNGVERVEFGTSEVVFNDGGANVDFRVEGNTKSNLFLIDAGNNSIQTDGPIGVGGASYGTAGQVLVSNGSSAAPNWEQVNQSAVVRVEDYGAVGNGQWSYDSSTGKYSLAGTDDTAAINSAIDYVYNNGGGTVVFDGTKTYKLSNTRDGTYPAIFIKPGINVDFNGATIAMQDAAGCIICAPPDYRTLGNIQALISEDVSARGKTFRVYSTGEINVGDELFFRVGDNPYDNRETQNAFFATVTAVTPQGTSYDITIDRGLPVGVAIADYGFTATAQVSSDQISISVTTSFEERGIETQDPIYFTTTGSMPSGLDENTPYFATSVTYDASIPEQKFKVSTTVQNAIDGVFVTISSAGSGNLQVYRCKNIYARRFVKTPSNQYIRNLNIECYIDDASSDGETSVISGIDMRYSRNIEHSNIKSTGNTIGVALLNYRYCFNVKATNIGLKMAKCRRSSDGEIIPSTGRFANMWNVENIAVNNYRSSACQGDFVFVESYAKSVLFQNGHIENTFESITGASRVGSVIFAAYQGSEVHLDGTRCIGSGSDFEFTNSAADGRPTWSDLELDLDDRISSLRFDRWTGGSFRDLLPSADGNVIDIHYSDKRRIKQVLHLDTRGRFLPVTESKTVQPPFGAVTGLRLQILGGNPENYAEALTITGTSFGSGKSDGTYTSSATTSSASDKGAGLEITYDVVSGTALNLVIADGGSGYVVNDAFVITDDTGVGGFVSSVSNDFVTQWRLNFSPGSVVFDFGAGASEITPSNDIVEATTASVYTYGVASGVDITSASANSYTYSASSITDPFTYVSVEMDYVPVRLSQEADSFESYDARAFETELWESSTDPSSNTDMNQFTWPRGSRCRKLQVIAGGPIGWVYVGGATTGWKEYGAIDS